MQGVRAAHRAHRVQDKSSVYYANTKGAPPSLRAFEASAIAKASFYLQKDFRNLRQIRRIGVVEAVGSSPVTQTNIKAHRNWLSNGLFCYISAPLLYTAKRSFTCAAVIFLRVRV